MFLPIRMIIPWYLHSVLYAPMAHYGISMLPNPCPSSAEHIQLHVLYQCLLVRGYLLAILFNNQPFSYHHFKQLSASTEYFSEKVHVLSWCNCSILNFMTKWFSLHPSLFTSSAWLRAMNCPSNVFTQSVMGNTDKTVKILVVVLSAFQSIPADHSCFFSDHCKLLGSAW